MSASISSQGGGNLLRVLPASEAAKAREDARKDFERVLVGATARIPEGDLDRWYADPKERARAT